MESIDKNNELPIKYQVRKSLEKYIINECKPGDRFFSERELADKFSVARGTVSRVIDQLVHKGLLVKVQGRGTFVSQPSQKLSTTISSIGVILPFSDNEGGGEIMQGISEVAYEKGYEILFATSHGLFEKEISHIERFKNITKGIIFYPLYEYKYHNNIIKYLSNVSREKFPFVLIDKHFEGINIPFVETDHREASYRATTCLAERGHTNIAHLTMRCWKVISSLNDRMEGYIQAVTERNFQPHIIEVSEQTMKMPARRFLRFIQENFITAISAASNQYIYLMQEEIIMKRLKMPDIEIAGIDQEFFRSGVPVMTVIQPKKEIGRDACRKLFDIMENKKIERASRLKPLPVSENTRAKQPMKCEVR